MFVSTRVYVLPVVIMNQFLRSNCYIVQNAVARVTQYSRNQSYTFEVPVAGVTQ